MTTDIDIASHEHPDQSVKITLEAGKIVLTTLEMSDLDGSYYCTRVLSVDAALMLHDELVDVLALAGGRGRPCDVTKGREVGK